MSYPFVKGIVLAEQLYHGGVKPVMARHFPELAYSAARLGRGSDMRRDENGLWWREKNDLPLMFSVRVWKDTVRAASQ